METAPHAVAAHPEPDYMKVFWWLLGLTIFEVAIIYVHLPKLFLALALILTAILKALLVAINYMHLKFEKWTLIVVPVVALLLVVDLLLGILPDLAGIPF